MRIKHGEKKKKENLSKIISISAEVGFEPRPPKYGSHCLCSNWIDTIRLPVCVDLSDLYKHLVLYMLEWNLPSPHLYHEGSNHRIRVVERSITHGTYHISIDGSY